MKKSVFLLFFVFTWISQMQAQLTGCPSIELSPQNQNITIDVNGDLLICENGQVVTLQADFLRTGSTTSYEVSAIPYAPPFPFVGSPNAISLEYDDRWSEIIDLGFNFCFFGENRSKALINDNGALTFSVQGHGGVYAPGGGTGYLWQTMLPSPPPPTGIGPLYRSAIFGAMQDLLPDGSFEGYSVNYEVTGTYPCRTLVFNVYNAGHYDCHTSIGPNTMQIVLYEGTNIIDVYVQDRAVCNEWNGGRGVIGIQNESGTLGFSPPGRNTGNWTAHEEAWRFTPNGAPNYYIEWIKDGEVIATNLEQIDVEVTESTVVTARITYDQCGGEPIVSEQVINIQMGATPVIGQPRNLTSCANAQGVATFDLTEIQPDLSVNPDFEFAYYLTLEDAQAEQNPIANPQAFQVALGSSPQTFYVNVKHIQANCFLTKDFTVRVYNCGIEVNSVPDIHICEGESNVFDLTQQAINVYNGSLSVNVTYHTTEEGALNGTAEIATPTSFTGVDGTTIWVRVEDVNDASLFGVTSFTIHVSPLPAVTSGLVLTGCSTGITGEGVFDFSAITPALIQNIIGLEVMYFSSAGLAQTGNPANALPTNYVGAGGEYYAYVRNTTTGCYVIEKVTLEVKDLPTVNQVGPVYYCDPNNDGFGIFNLTQLSHDIAGNPIPSDIVVSYHETLASAENNVSAIAVPSSYINSQSGGQTVYARVAYQNSNCYVVVPVELIVVPTPNIQSPGTLYSCDATISGQAIFDLTTTETDILNGLSAADHTITYHTTYANASAGVGAIANPSSYSSAGTSLIYIRVENNASGCYSVAVMTLEVTTVPYVAAQLPEYQLCDDNNDGFGVFDLTSHNDEIIGTNTELLVTYHYTNADAENGVNALSASYQNVVANIQTIFVRVEDPLTGCYTVRTLNLRVTSGPVVNVPTTPYYVCGTNQSGFGTINLPSYGNPFINGTNYTIQYFENQYNAEHGLSPILNPESYTNIQGTNATIWIRVVDPATNCYSVYPMHFTLELAPVLPAQIPSIVLCDSEGDLYDGVTRFDLTVQNSTLLAGQGGTGPYTIRYYTTEAAALAGSPWIPDPVNFFNTAQAEGVGQTIWVRIIDESTKNKCSDVGSFELYVKSPLIIGSPRDIELCNEGLPNDEQTVFDLTTYINDILNPYPVYGVTIAYHSSYASALAGLADINAQSYTNTQNPQTIWVSVTSEEGCKIITSFTIRVLPLPEPNMNPTPLYQCEEASGAATFDLTASEVEIGNGAGQLTYEYFTTYEGATEGNPAGGVHADFINTPEDYLSTSGVVYVRVSNALSGGKSCFVVVPLTIEVTPATTAGPVSDFVNCETNHDGNHTFNLNDKLSEILGAQSSTEYEVRYFDTEEDATNKENGIYHIQSVTPVTGDRVIWVRVEHIERGCFAITSFTIRERESVVAFVPEDRDFCDTDGVNDGQAVVNLTELNAEVIGTQNAAAVATVRYYASAAAYAQGVMIANPASYLVQSTPQTIIAEVNNDGCTASVSFEINIIDAPEMATIADGVVCQDYRTGELYGYLMDTELSADLYDFVWRRNGTDLNSNTSSYTATEAGTYEVTATSKETGCSATQSITVTLAPAITIDVVNMTAGFSEVNAIEIVASPVGPQYEYALDEGPYQDSPIFTDVTPGEHTVWVRIKGNTLSVACPASKVVTILNHPKYFTPNGDGYNDTWNIWALKNQPEAKIYIFDRYGKLLKQLTGAGQGWDGTFNGEPMPSTDYWFKAEYVEPTTGLPAETTGHFTLKR